MADPGTLELVGRHLTNALQPLTAAVSDTERFKQLLYRLGWNATALPPAYAALGTAVSNAAAKLEALGDPPTINQILDLLTAVKAAFDAIKGISVAPPGVNAGAFLAEIGDRLFELLLTDHLSAELPAAFSLLQALNVIDIQSNASTPGRPSFIRTQFRWERISKIISEPAKLPSETFGWGTPNLRVDRIVDVLSRLFYALGFPARVTPPSPRLLNAYLDRGHLPALPSPPSLIVPFYFVEIAGRQLQAALALRAQPATKGGLPGIILEPQIPDKFPLKISLADGITLRILAQTNIATTLGVIINPSGISIKYPFAPGTIPPSAGVGVGFDFAPQTPALLFGAPKETRLEFAGGSVDISTSLVNGDLDVVFGAQLKGLTLVLTAGESDSFIQHIIGSGESRVAMTLGFEWSRRNGVRFTGSGGFEVAVHPHLHIGPVSIDDVTVRLFIPTPRPPDARLELGAGISVQLGPLAFFVQGIGLRLDATFKPGNVGPFDLSVGFKPPNGLGLSLDAGGFKGGGFLVLDSEKGEYAGGLELEFIDVVSVKAVGILNTKMPDGSPGFSLLIIITAEFPPIQLSFGFTLLGVGGLLGLNRTTALDALRAGIHDGSIESVLFPHDVVANASRIINDLKRIFPPLSDRFLVGPMAKLGWGTPTLISLELGLILEIPRPAFALVGVLRLALPAEDVAVLNLQVNFLGVVDFDTGQLSFDASLFDSHLLTFALTGDMAVRVYWKENANFLLTVGGFHPAYTPPPMGLPSLQRLSIDMFTGLPQIRAESYFAITSNTVQFGAKVELYAGADIFNVYGFMAYDVLIQFNPLHFIAEFSAMLAVRSGSATILSVRVDALLEGPTPWHAKGTGSFEIGFIITITISVHFDATFGDDRTTVLPPIDVLPLLADALQNPGNWRAVLPSSTSQRVSLRSLPPDSKDLVLHPFGSLQISQKVVPLHLTISRFGTQRPDKGTLFDIPQVKFGIDAAPKSNVREQFAPSQFLDLGDAEKLSRRSFEQFDAGVVLGSGDAPRADYMAILDVVYEVIYVPAKQLRIFFKLSQRIFEALIRVSAVARTKVSFAPRAPSVLSTPPVSMQSEQFGVATTLDLTLHQTHLVFESEAEAHQAVTKLTAKDPGLHDEIQVLPMYQVRKAA